MTTPTALTQTYVSIVQNLLEPLASGTGDSVDGLMVSGIVGYVSLGIGLCLLYIGLHRIRHHGQGMSSKHYSPLGTIFYFIAGAVCLQYETVAQSLAVSLFGDTGNVVTTMGAYIDIINNESDPAQQTLDFAFAMLLAIGIVSFLRGFIILVKMGEGASEGALPKALTHIFAGVVGINASAAYALITNLVSTISGS
jgi:hypothetical protein